MSHENFEQLWVLNEQGAARLATYEEIVSAARSVMSRRVRRGVSMASPKLVKDFLSTKLGALEHETFCVMLLDLCGAIIYVQCGLVAAAGAGFRAVWST